MTQLQTIINNHISLECRCGHRKRMSVKELISKLNPTATIYEVARKAIRWDVKPYLNALEKTWLSLLENVCVAKFHTNPM